MIQISEPHAALGIISGAVFWCLSIYLVARHSFERGRLDGLAENDKKHRPDCSAAWKSAPMSQVWNSDGDPELRGSLPFEKPKLDKFEAHSISAVSQKRVSYADELMGHPPGTESTKQ